MQPAEIWPSVKKYYTQLSAVMHHHANYSPSNCTPGIIWPQITKALKYKWLNTSLEYCKQV